MTFTITVDVDNDAFTEDAAYETVRILRTVIDRLMRNGLRPGDTHPLFDHNGNRVGDATLSETSQP